MGKIDETNKKVDEWVTHLGKCRKCARLAYFLWVWFCDKIVSEDKEGGKHA